MKKRLLYQNSMEETLQQLLQDREQQLMQINRELQHLPGGSLHIRKRNGRIFVCEYSNGREKRITREKDRKLCIRDRSGAEAGRQSRDLCRTDGNRRPDRNVHQHAFP